MNFFHFVALIHFKNHSSFTASGNLIQKTIIVKSSITNRQSFLILTIVYNCFDHLLMKYDILIHITCCRTTVSSAGIHHHKILVRKFHFIPKKNCKPKIAEMEIVKKRELCNVYVIRINKDEITKIRFFVSFYTIAYTSLALRLSLRSKKKKIYSNLFTFRVFFTNHQSSQITIMIKIVFALQLKLVEVLTF